MNGTDVELRKELWMWRGTIIILLAIVIMLTVSAYFVDKKQHDMDNEERRKNWQLIQSNQAQILSNLRLTNQMMMEVNASLSQCGNCHTKMLKGIR